MKIFKHIEAVIWLGVVLATVNPRPIWAESKSATINVSCRIGNVLQVSSFGPSQSTSTKNQTSDYFPENSSDNGRQLLGIQSSGIGLRVKTNLDDFHKDVASQQTAAGVVQVHTVTA